MGRGLGALIPDAASNDRPVDVFFSGGEAEEGSQGAEGGSQGAEEAKAPRAARTDPAASMQSSRRRKPKAGTTTETSTAKMPEKTTEASDSAPAQKATGTTSSKGAKSAPTKAATTKSTSGKSAGKATGKTAASQEAAKSGGAKSTGTGSAGAKSTAKTAATTKSTGEKSTVAKSSGAKATGTKAPASTPSPDSNSVKPAPSEKAPRVVTDSEPKADTVEAAEESVATVPTAAVSTPTETAEPDVEAASDGAGNAPTDDDAATSDDVSETHPGVYRSGHEVFDPARDVGEATAVETTNEVSTDTESSVESESPDSAAGDDETAPDSQPEGAGVDSIPDTEYGEVNVDLIDANPRQPRTFFDEDQLSELVHSIREIGVLQPVVIRQKPSDPERFELIMGERRLRATKDANLPTIPAIIRYVDDTDLLRDALLENLHRAELNPLEEAAAYGQLLEDFGCTQEELSERIGRSRPQISNTLRLLRLPPLVQRRVAAGVISAGHARAILGLREPEHMEVLAQRIVAEGLSVRASEEAVVLLNRGDSMNVSRGTTRVSPEFVEVADRLGDRLDTKVNITVGKKKGKLSVEFANQDDLDRILNLLGVESPAE